MKTKFNNFYNVAILPPTDVWNYAVALGREIKKKADVYFVIDGKEYLPHITLYHIAVSDKDFFSFSAVIERIIEHQIFSSIETRGIRGDKSIEISLSKPKWLEELEKDIILNTAKYYDPKFDHIAYWRSQPGFKVIDEVVNSDAFKRFKDFQFGDSYSPHITLSVLKPGEDKAKLIDYLPKKYFNFTPQKIAICRMREFWQCYEVIKEFNIY